MQMECLNKPDLLTMQHLLFEWETKHRTFTDVPICGLMFIKVAWPSIQGFSGLLVVHGELLQGSHPHSHPCQGLSTVHARTKQYLVHLYLTHWSCSSWLNTTNSPTSHKCNFF